MSVGQLDILDIPTAGPTAAEDGSPPAFEPYIPAGTTMRELTVLPPIKGTTALS